MRRIIHAVLLCLVTLLVSQFHSGLRAFMQSDQSALLTSQLEALQSITNEKGTTVNILLCLSGDAYGFLEETKVAIKSLILNAPHNGQLHIYIMADKSAYEALLALFNETLPSGTIWWCPIAIRIINIESEISRWQREIKKIANPMATLHHTWGTYYRLFFNRYLPSSVDYIIYMDPDTVVTANLAHLWNYTKNSSDWLFLWRSECAGFLLLRNSPELWELAAQVDNKELPDEQFNDQKILQLIALHHPDVAQELPPAWGMHWARDWRSRKNFLQDFPQLGMGHFNGGGPNPGAFWTQSVKHDLDEFHNEWGSFFYYYIHMPWSFARFIGESSAVGGGYPVTVDLYANAKALVNTTM